MVTVTPIGTDGARFGLSWDETTYEIDVARLGPGRLSVIVLSAGHTSREIFGHEATPGELMVGVGGQQVRVRVADGRRRSGIATTHTHGGGEVSAPMPGRIVRVLVKPGDRVLAGQAVAVVEAMKMENEVSSSAAGVVSSVSVAAGDSVEVGRVLATVEAVETTNE